MSRLLSPQWWKLDADQAAVFSHEGACVVIAGPGSGKTRTVVARAARLIHLNGPGRVVLSTFSRAAAGELKQRLGLVLRQQAAAARLRVHTLHSLSLGLLNLRRDRSARYLIAEQTSRDLIRRCALHLGVDERQLETVIGQVQALKAVALDLGFTRDGPTDLPAAVAVEYQARLQADQAMDMADLVREATLALQAGQVDLDAAHLIVDEAQDIDPVQLEFIGACVRQGAVVTAVADDDQSIYGFRAALGYRALSAIAERAGAAVLHLGNNYRSARDIVEGSAYVIEDSTQRFDKRIRAVREERGRVALRTYADEASQAQHVADDVAARLAAQASWNAAVIARTNLELDLVEAALVAQDVPVNRLGGTGLLKRESIRRFLGLLALVDAPSDANRLLSGMELVGLSTPSRQRIDNHLKSGANEPPLDRLYDTALLEQLGKQDTTLLRGWRDDLAAYLNAGQHARDDAARNHLLVHHGGRLLAHSPDLRLRQDGSFLLKLLAGRRKGAVAARIRAFEAHRSSKDARTTVLTAHASKGLEFHAVWVVNCNDGRFPIEGGDTDEERRLFYVAMTRARDALTLCSLAKEARSAFVEALRRKALLSMDRREVVDRPAEILQDFLDDGLHGTARLQADVARFEIHQTALQ